MVIGGLLLETLQNEFGASVRTASKSLTESVGITNESARWVPGLLASIEKDRDRRVAQTS